MANDLPLKSKKLTASVSARFTLRQAIVAVDAPPPDKMGAAIIAGTYSLSTDAFGRFAAAVPSSVIIGNVELNDGTWVKSFLCEPYALNGATNITSFGGWSAWLGA